MLEAASKSQLVQFFMPTNLKTDAPSLAAIRAKLIDWIVAFMIPPRLIAIALMLVFLHGQSRHERCIHARARLVLVVPVACAISLMVYMFSNAFNISISDCYVR